MEKTKFVSQLQVETITVLPRTMVIDPQPMNNGGVITTMFVVYGLDAAQRKVWLATFVDDEEAQAWVQGSKTFGRPVRGAVIAGQELKSEKGAEMSDGAVAVGNNDSGSASKPN